MISRALLESIIAEGDNTARIAGMVGSDGLSTHAFARARDEITAANNHPVGSEMYNKHVDEHKKWLGVHSTIMKHYYDKNYRGDLAKQHAQSAENAHKNLHVSDEAYANKTSHHWKDIV